jgi:predicted amidohydrolase
MVKLVVSVAQACTDRYDLPATLAKMERLVKQAKERDNSQVLVFPEALCVVSLLSSLVRVRD